MPVPRSQFRVPGVVGPLGSLAFSRVSPRTSALALRTVAWHKGLERLGVRVPFFVAHDVGLLLSVLSEQRERGPRANSPASTPAVKLSLEAYDSFLGELQSSQLSVEARDLRMNDDLVTVVLSRLLGPVAERIDVRPNYTSEIPIDASLFEGIDGQLDELARAVEPRSFETAWLAELVRLRLGVLTVCDAIDVDTIRLFGMLGSEGAAGAIAQVDMLGALGSPEANDVVNFSLELLPSVLETKTRTGAGTTVAHGYSGLSTKGSIDNLVLTELVWDDLELARRLAENEVLYYAREQTHEEERRIHVLLVDASASMRGDRATFARGMTIATAKKLQLEGEEVIVRFFDSRLYEPLRAPGGGLPIAGILGFRGERGRNPARVFAQLAAELEALAVHDPRQVILHLFTHAALYAPRPVVEMVTRHANLSGVFILPSGGELALDYLDLFDAHWVVDHRALATSGERAERAKSILVETRARADAPPSSLRRGSGGPASQRAPGSQRAPASSRRSSP